jgi:N-acetylmuramoyl-L-alanine amidase
MPSTNFNDRPANTKIDTIILHHTASNGSAQDIGRYFESTAAQVSSHYTVGKDGTIVQSVADEKRAWHAGNSDYRGRQNVNDFSLGIEIVNRGDNSDPYTDIQYQALANLIAWMMQTYKVPMDRITGHRNVSHEGKVDPSNNFDWNRVRSMVSQKMGTV